MFRMMQKDILEKEIRYVLEYKDSRLKIFVSQKDLMNGCRTIQIFLTSIGISTLGLKLSLDINNTPFITSNYPVTIHKERIPELKEFLQDYEEISIEIENIIEEVSYGSLELFEQKYSE